MKHEKYLSERIGLIFLIPLILIQTTSCKKYLDKKPLQNQVVPTTLNDLQALLDNDSHINLNITPGMIDIVADDYYVKTSDWLPRTLDERLNYIWDGTANHLNSWVLPYQNHIFYSNFVLDILPKITVTNANEESWNSIKGSALFYRSFAFHQLAQLFCKPYSTSATSDFGIVLKLTSAIEEPIKRSSVQQTYDQIIGDLKTAADLLPAITIFPTRPNKAAAYGALARTYLAMRDYVNAGKYANLCLQQYNILIDYNTTNIPFHRFNPETIYYNFPQFINIQSNSRAKIDSNLYQSYADDDLRKIRFFKANTGMNIGTYSFQGSYDGDYAPYISWDGIATDEIYLIRAESYARAGNKDAALTDLNTLMIKRWKNTVPYPVITGTDATDALNKILIERRKELLFRGVRWSDLRRLNLEGANITLKRVINGITYTLPPADPRWVLLIPQQIINFGGIEQNPR